MTQTIALISVDVGGTLGSADGPGLAMTLAAASPLPGNKVREIMRSHLHTQPAITDDLATEISTALHIPVSDFPRNLQPAPFDLYPQTLDALRTLCQIAPVVTLSNVTCVDADTENLRQRLAPWVTDLFPSCRIGHSKPDPRAFLTVAEAFGVPPASMVHIGDDWACDIVGALNAGVTPIWISQGRPIPDQARAGARHDVHVAADIQQAAALLAVLNPQKGNPS